MKCLLIYPPITTYGSDSPAGVAVLLGLAYIAAVLEKNGYEVKVLDSLALGSIEKGENYIRRGLSKDAIEKYIRDFKPSIVGISSMFTAYAQDAHDVARIIKGIDRNIPVIFGGAHASANYDMVLRDENVDIVVKGEGEITFLEVVRVLERGGNLETISGIITRIDGKLHVNPERPFISDLDSLPFPARHLLPMDIYLSSKTSSYCMRKPHTVMITSRGCPRNCIFCSIHSIWGHKWRTRSARNVVDEIELLVNKYRVKEISFNDDNMSLDRKRMAEICDEIIARKIDIRWTTPNGIAIWSLDEPLLRKMKQSGCYRLTFGIESGNSETQKFIRKSLDLEQARSIIKCANKIGLWTISTNIIGFPYETREAIEDTINFAITSDTDFALFYFLTPHPGTPIYEILKREKLVPDDITKGFLIGESACDTKVFTRKELEEIQNHAYSKFISSRLRSYFKNPVKILRKIRSFEDIKYVFRLARRALTIKARMRKYGIVGAKVLHDQEV